VASVSLRLDGVCKKYGEATILNDLALEVLDGELFVLLGPSGCGKTTLLRAVAGLVPIDRGRIELAGRDITTRPAEDRNIAMVFQDYALYPHMTVRDNLAFGLKRHRIPRDEIGRRIDRVSRMLAIEGLLRRKPQQLSGGQQQRVALGRAIVREPSLYLMDEPLSNLDAQIRAATRAELKQLQRRLGVTSLYVTHDQIEAMTLADRLAVMSHGRFEQIGPPLEVYREPATVFVARFLANPRLNVLDGELSETPHGQGVTTIVATFPLRDRPGARERRVQVGIRPEWLRLSTSMIPGALALEVTLVEPLGVDMLIHARHETVDLVCRMSVESMPLDQKQVWINAEASRVDVFAMDGRRIRPSRTVNETGGSSAS
jgi:ABC-type sugar transport system ATPase subunit